MKQKGRSMMVGIIRTSVDRYGTAYSRPTLTGLFYIDVPCIVLDFEDDDGDTYTYEMLMPSGTVVPIQYDPKTQAYIVVPDTI